MPQLHVHTTEHSVEVAADPQALYGVVADADRWPHVFPPTVHVERLEGGAGWEQLRLWAFANGEVRSWTSRRELDAARLRVSFRQEVSSPPVASMGGEWRIERLPGGRVRVVLLHDFSVLDDSPQAAAWVGRAVDANSTAELAALRSAAETLTARPEVLLSFRDTVDIAAAGKEVYDFLYRADLWEERLPHVSRLVLGEEVRNLQTVEMDTRAVDGAVHTTRSVRVCFPHDRIVYKQTEVPELMAAHTGRWTLVPIDPGADRWPAAVGGGPQDGADQVEPELGPDRLPGGDQQVGPVDRGGVYFDERFVRTWDWFRDGLGGEIQRPSSRGHKCLHAFLTKMRSTGRVRFYGRRLDSWSSVPRVRCQPLTGAGPAASASGAAARKAPGSRSAARAATTLKAKTTQYVPA